MVSAVISRTESGVRRSSTMLSTQVRMHAGPTDRQTNYRKMADRMIQADSRAYRSVRDADWPTAY